MKKRQLTKDIYNQYCNDSYIVSIICAEDLFSKLEMDYSSGIVTEEDLLLVLDSFLKINTVVFLTDKRIRENVIKMLQNASSNNINTVNSIKIFLNSIDENDYDDYTFLKSQYIMRKYGFENQNKIIGKYKSEMLNTSKEFLINSKEQLYSAVGFDFKLISALGTLSNGNGVIYEECLKNYQLFSSINYFKIQYPYMFKDKVFLKFIESITKFQDLNREPINVTNCLFDDFYVENRKTLNYVNRGLKRL